MPFTLPSFSQRSNTVVADIIASIMPSKRIINIQAPLTLGIENGARFAFPIDPVVSVQGKSIITRRNVAKGGTMHGTIKESWREDDWTVTISGSLTYDTAQDLDNAIGELRSLCESGVALKVTNELLNKAFGITSLVVESYDFSHTKGLCNQSFSLTCYSDDSYTLLVDKQQ